MRDRPPRGQSAGPLSPLAHPEGCLIAEVRLFFHRMRSAVPDGVGPAAKFTVYSADVNRFVYVRLAVEQPATGGLFPYFDSGSVQLNSGIYPGKFVRKIVLRAILACACIVFMVQECSEVFTLGCRKYCSSFWNCLEMTNLLGFVMYAVFLMIGAAWSEQCTLDRNACSGGRGAAVGCHLHQ